MLFNMVKLRERNRGKIRKENKRRKRHKKSKKGKSRKSPLVSFKIETWSCSKKERHRNRCVFFKN